MINKSVGVLIIFFLTMSAITACSTLFEDYDKKELENKEFDKVVEIKEMETPATEPEAVPASDAKASKEKSQPSKKDEKKKTSKKEKDVSPEKKSSNKATEEDSKKSAKHLPPIEDGVGFDGRRPVVDPFVVGEEAEYSVSYFGVEAGKFKMSIKPFVEVNGKKSYHFSYSARSSSVFSVFYAVDDKADAYLDYENLVPYSYTISAKESKQVRDVRSFFNWKTKIAKTWDKKIKKGKEPQVEEYEWEMAPYAQSVFTVAYYLRCFTLKVGKDLAVNVAHEGKNIVMTAKIVREEKLKIPSGTINTFVVKPSFEVDGVFKPVGDIFLWLAKDDRKRIVRIESKIKIGTIVVGVEKMTP
jgi:hypothetical protein